MRIALTSAGIAALQSATQPVVLGSYKLGDGIGYIPDINDTDIHGTEVASGVPQKPIVVNANVLRYSTFIGRTVGPFQFGEIGLFLQNGDLFALACDDVLYDKESIGSDGEGNSVSLDAYVSISNGNFDIWIDLGMNNELRLPTIPSVDQLPPSHDAIPNIYAVTPATSSQSTFLAYTDRNGLWMFDAYKFGSTVGTPIPIKSATTNSLTFDIAYYDTNWVSNYLGQLIIEFASGQCYSICRNVSAVINNGSDFTVTFSTALLIQPAVGDLVIRFNREGLTTSSLILPVATTTELGAVIIGAGLDVQPDGTISVDPSTVPGGLVTSVNQQQGDVELEVSDIPGAVASVNGQTPDANGNVTVPSNYVLPTAGPTVKGGVVVPGPDLVVNQTTGVLSLGFTPVRSVNGNNGDVIILGLIDPTAIGTGGDFNAIVTTGLYFAATDAIATSLVNGPTIPGGLKAGKLEVIQTTADGSNVQQRWSQGDAYMFERSIVGGTPSSWQQIGGISSVPIATTSALGVVRISSGLTITTGGLLSADVRSVNDVTPDSNGNIVIDIAALGGLTTEEVGIQGGIAGFLTIDPVQPPVDEAVSDYTYARLPQKQLPLGAMIYMGEWDASTNAGSYIDTEADGEVVPHTVVLMANGEMQDDWDDSGVPTSIQVPANGKWFRVSTAGTTNLDGEVNWLVGDYAVAIGDKWVRISPTPVITKTSGTMTIGPGSSSVIAPPSGSNPLDVQVQLRVEDTTTAGTWYDADGVATIRYTSTTINVTNEHPTDTLNFRYVIRNI